MLFISLIVLSFLVFCFYDFFQTSVKHTCFKVFFSSLFLGGFVGLMTVHTHASFILLIAGAVGINIVEIAIKHKIQE